MTTSNEPNELTETGVDEGDANQTLDSRKAAVLRAVVEQHVDTGLPVGSGHVSASAGLGVSAATVRNDMSQLERDGYLTHPHTSAGRVPTDKGYRFFVDQLDPLRSRAEQPPTPQALQVRDFFARAHGEIEQLLAQTSRMLASLTEHASVIVGPPSVNASIRGVQLVELAAPGAANVTALLVAVLDNGVIEKRAVELPATTSSATLASAGSVLQRHLAGRSLDDVDAPWLRSGEVMLDTIIERCVLALRPDRTTNDEPEVFVGGAARLAADFDTVQTVRAVLGALEQHLVVVSLLREALDRRANVSIGAEHGAEATFEHLAACSVVVAPYQVDGRPAGTIGVLGPTRMNYPAVMSAVADVSAQLSRRLSEG